MKVLLREITNDDMELVLAWRNSPLPDFCRRSKQ